MTKFITINLLPYREREQQERKKQFQWLMIISLAIAIGIAVAVYLFLSTVVSTHESRNDYLKSEITKLNKEIEEVKNLQYQKELFLMRKTKIEELDNQRFRVAKILDDLNHILPEGTYLTKITGDDKGNYTFSGNVINDNKVALFMNSLPSTGYFTMPELVNIQSKDDAQQFTIKADLFDPVKEKTKN